MKSGFNVTVDIINGIMKYVCVCVCWLGGGGHLHQA